MGISTKWAECKIYRRSIDARKKEDIKFVYSVSVKTEAPKFDEKRLLEHNISVLRENRELEFFCGNEQLDYPPLVVGSGPCGLFAALLLAERGYSPILIERGGSIKERNEAVKKFAITRKLNPDTNIQFGAGGAGTFSDGKLVTRINDPLTEYILKRFVDFGAPEEIEYIARPHIGTDILSNVVDNILRKIEELGGRVVYNTKLLSLQTEKSTAKTTRGDIRYGALVLAIGHSARDTYFSLFDNQFSIVPKSFSVGMRIEHLADDIDFAMYGDAPREILGRAEYNLSHNTKERGVYTFCMCPGGTVVAATSEEGGVCVNGMSEHKRNGKNSNSAVVCSIFPEDYGATPQSAIEFQRKIEKSAFLAAGSDYSAPMITLGDFLSNKCSAEPTKVVPTYMDGKGVVLASPEKYLPTVVTSAIGNAIVDFDKKIHGFADSAAVLTGPETRTSAPIRIMRDPTSLVAVGFDNIYPAGEGAGYAGGITSAAIDGVRTAIALMKRYKPQN
ncbi:MAG: FAD-dependent monooxygenase [Clostridia bacterium]|nr:FAD-dependent monooxygenase [Clostridia bacterium]